MHIEDIEYAHIALVEDDKALAKLTAAYLNKEGYRVTILSDGPDALAKIPILNPDCVLLDIMLPGMDGVEVCRRLRSNYFGPIIFLTAKGDQLDEILGLEVGGDDYLAKPVEPRLLLAHIRAHIRRIERPASIVAESENEFEIDLARESICYQGKSLLLSQPEFHLLNVLINNANTIVSRDQVMLAVRGIEHDGYSRAVDLLVSEVRKKLANPEWIKTIRSKGYIWQGSAIKI